MDDDRPTAQLFPDELSLAQPDPAAMERDALVVEVRRLRLRLAALREQRDERIDQIRALEQQLLALLRGDESAWSGAPSLLGEWRQRALDAEARYAALLDTRSMRLLRVPRRLYARVRTAQGR